MPLISEGELLGSTGFTTEAPSQPAVSEENKPGFIDTAVAAFKLENTVANLLRTGAAPEILPTTDTTFDPIAKLEADYPDMLPHASKFVRVRDEEHFERIRSNIEWETEQRAIIDRGPTAASIAGGLIGGVADPLLFVPVIGAASKAMTVGRAAFVVGANAAAGTAAQELILQSTQELRTAEESAINVLGAAALGGMLGAGVSALTASSRSLASEAFVKATKGEELAITADEIMRPDGNLSAAMFSEKEGLGIANVNETVTKVLSGNLGPFDDVLAPPDLRAAVSESESVRKVGEVFYNSAFLRNKNLEGVATRQNAQNAIFRHDMQVQKTVQEVDELYFQHTGAGQIRSALATPEGKLKINEFSTQVWRGIVDPEDMAIIPEARQAAEKMRADMNAIGRELQKEGILGDIDPEFMHKYLSRKWDVNKLQSPAVQQKLTNKLTDFLSKNNFDGTPRMEKLADGTEVATKLDDEAATKLAQDFVEKIRGETDQQIAMSMVAEDFISKGKFTKERVLQIPDTEIAEFLETDAISIFQSYNMRAARLLETQRALKRAGFESVTDVLARIREEKNRAVIGLTDSPEDLAKAVEIGKKYSKEEDLVKNMYRSMLGQIYKPGSMGNLLSNLRKYQTMRLLGGVTVSSLGDVMLVPFRKGLLNTLKDAWYPMISDMRNFKLSTEQLDDLTGAIEFEQNNILRAIGGEDDLANIGRNRNALDKGLDIAGDVFTKATGIGYWTGLGRRIAAQTSSADLIRTLSGEINENTVAKLASLGIEKRHYKMLNQQIKKHSKKVGSTWFLNPQAWDNAEALGIMKNAIQLDVESTILRPGVESLPFAVQKSDMGKVLFQFKSFATAATGKILISGLSRRDAQFASGLMMVITGGMMVDVLKDLVAGRDPKSDPADLLLAGISRSGIGGLMAGTALDLGRALSGDYGTRYGDDSLAGAVFGPALSTVQSTGKLLAHAFKDAEEGEINKSAEIAGKMLPFQNLFYTNSLFSKIFGDEE